MEYPIPISNINDFIFCPISIYFHGQYQDTEKLLYQGEKQINGSYAHKAIDSGGYSTRRDVLQAKDVYCEAYGIIGKIDTFDIKTGILTERKKHINKIYDGYVFQLYAQYYSLLEMGYAVKKLFLYSFDDNKKYAVPLPEEDERLFLRFEETIAAIKEFNPLTFVPTEKNKCDNCIYSDICDRSLADD